MAILYGGYALQVRFEMTVLGPRLRFLAGTSIAIAGGNLSPKINGQPCPTWRTVEVASGSILSFLGPQDGLRAYLAIAGGIDVPVIMGSRSTYLKAEIGGLEGRALKAGDTLSVLETSESNIERFRNGLSGIYDGI